MTWNIHCLSMMLLTTCLRYAERTGETLHEAVSKIKHALTSLCLLGIIVVGGNAIMKEFVIENKKWVKITAISTLIYILVFKIIAKIIPMIPLLNAFLSIFENWTIGIYDANYSASSIIAILITLPLAISLIVLIIKAIQKLIKW